MVRVVLLEVFGSQEAHHELVWVAVEHNIVFYVDDSHIAGRKPIWEQTNLTAAVRMFERLGLLINMGNTK